MIKLNLPENTPTKKELNNLAKRCKAAYERLKDSESETRLPVFIEFSGSPKSGKTTIIGIIAHFFKRMAMNVAQPAEGASLRTPVGLRDDWLSFNAWSGCYALQQILIDSNEDSPPDIVILDRGLFDIAAWMEFLCTSQKRISEDDRIRITDFFISDLWRRRVQTVFLFTADYPTSLIRETSHKLTEEPGSVMNEDTLTQLLDAYTVVGTRHAALFDHLYHVDTSFVKDQSPSFQRIAYVVADAIVSLMEELGTQMLLVTDRVLFDGFVTEQTTVQAKVAQIVSEKKFLERSDAEKSQDVQQVVPYAIVENDDGRYFWARRKSNVKRKALQGKNTILVGGHAEKRDWHESEPASVFERCLRRELEEELVGIQVREVIPLGLIHDSRNEMGYHHLAFIHRVKIGGKTSIRRQALDQEFGRESVSWKTADEIKQAVVELDPWSQLVAHELFGATIPPLSSDPTLFTGMK
ncbi:MAG: hypothetical protein HJJLKODD_02991 [Phycisphaerae bacterium]|nr:hypothetical protein [Phycisphaerae bacterium]